MQTSDAFLGGPARCLGGQLLLRPSKLVDGLIAGVLASAEEHYAALRAQEIL